MTGEKITKESVTNAVQAVVVTIKKELGKDVTKDSLSFNREAVVESVKKNLLVDTVFKEQRLRESIGEALDGRDIRNLDSIKKSNPLVYNSVKGIVDELKVLDDPMKARGDALKKAVKNLVACVVLLGCAALAVVMVPGLAATGMDMLGTTKGQAGGAVVATTALAAVSKSAYDLVAAYRADEKRIAIASGKAIESILTTFETQTHKVLEAEAAKGNDVHEI